MYESQSFLLPAVTLAVGLHYLVFSTNAVAGVVFIVALAAMASSIALHRGGRAVLCSCEGFSTGCPQAVSGWRILLFGYDRMV
jgi:hypothetical protein